MRTLYVGSSYRDHTNGFKRTSYQSHHHWDRDEADLRDDDIPVFDRRTSGHRGEYERKGRNDDVERLAPWERGWYDAPSHYRIQNRRRYK